MIDFYDLEQCKGKLIVSRRRGLFCQIRGFIITGVLLSKRVLESGVCRGGHEGDETVGRYLGIHGLPIHQYQMSFQKGIGTMEGMGF